MHTGDSSRVAGWERLCGGIQGRRRYEHSGNSRYQDRRRKDLFAKRAEGRAAGNNEEPAVYFQPATKRLAAGKPRAYAGEIISTNSTTNMNKFIKGIIHFSLRHRFLVF